MLKNNYTIRLFVLIIVSLMVLIHFSRHTCTASDISQAVNLAIEQMVLTSEDYKTALQTFGMSYDLVQSCNASQSYDWPATITVPSNTLVACSENVVGAPWVVSVSSGFYNTFSHLLQEELQKRYPQINVKRTVIDASRGYFPSLRDAVNSGACHMVISSTNINAEREQEVQFGCPHSAAKRAIFRGPLDPEIELDTLSKLNDTRVKVAILVGTSWEALIQPYFPSATITYAGSFDECMNLVKNGDVHVSLLHDVVINYWKPSNCPDCQMYTFGDTLQFGIFYKKEESNESARLCTSWITIAIISLISILMTNIMRH